jgi:hypothetical protein
VSFTNRHEHLLLCHGACIDTRSRSALYAAVYLIFLLQVFAIYLGIVTLLTYFFTFL